MNIYMLGIGGVGMGNLASLLKQAGHHVSGVDQAVYPPMSDFLATSAIPYKIGFSAANLPPSTDLMVVGNVVRADNPEVAAAKQRGLNMLSMPQTIRQYLLQGRESIVIAGTHGKTTTTSLMTHALRSLGEDPGFLIGGIANDLQTGSGLGSGKYFVLEGDEYDSAFFQKEPKFLSYQPKYLVLTSVEFDHADIYKDLGEVVEQFRKVAAIVPNDGHVLVCSDYPEGLRAAQSAKCPVYRYGRADDDDFQVREIRRDVAAGLTRFSLRDKRRGRTLELATPMPGDYNAMNAAAVASTLWLLGKAESEIAAALRSFQGVRRRQQLLLESRQDVVVEDFAHHPTAISVTLDALRQAWPEREIWALFEPRSNTVRRNYFQQSLPAALAHADHVLLYRVYKAETLAEDVRLNRQAIRDEMAKLGKPCELVESVDTLVEIVASQRHRPRLIVVMTNGDFDGLKPKLLAALRD